MDSPALRRTAWCRSSPRRPSACSCSVAPCRRAEGNFSRISTVTHVSWRPAPSEVATSSRSSPSMAWRRRRSAMPPIWSAPALLSVRALHLGCTCEIDRCNPSSTADRFSGDRGPGALRMHRARCRHRNGAAERVRPEGGSGGCFACLNGIAWRAEGSGGHHLVGRKHRRSQAQLEDLRGLCANGNCCQPARQATARQRAPSLPVPDRRRHDAAGGGTVVFQDGHDAARTASAIEHERIPNLFLVEPQLFDLMGHPCPVGTDL